MKTRASLDEAILRWLIQKDFPEVLVTWIGENFDPEDIFTDRELEEWAINHGYVSFLDIDNSYRGV